MSQEKKREKRLTHFKTMPQAAGKKCDNVSETEEVTNLHVLCCTFQFALSTPHDLDFPMAITACNFAIFLIHKLMTSAPPLQNLMAVL